MVALAIGKSLMMRIVNLDGAERVNWYYGGNAGRKICIEMDGSRWMVKFPEPTAGMRGRVASYATSPLSEWLGSHIYESLGIDTHETVLGYCEGRLVCACRDFAWPNKRLVEFHDMKRSPEESRRRAADCAKAASKKSGNGSHRPYGCSL